MGIEETVDNITEDVDKVSKTIDRSPQAVIVIISVSFAVFFGYLYWNGYSDKNKDIAYYKGLYEAKVAEIKDKDLKITFVERQLYISDSTRQANADYWYNLARQYIVNKGFLHYDTTNHK